MVFCLSLTIIEGDNRRALVGERGAVDVPWPGGSAGISESAVCIAWKMGQRSGRGETSAFSTAYSPQNLAAFSNHVRQSEIVTYNRRYQAAGRVEAAHLLEASRKLSPLDRHVVV